MARHVQHLGRRGRDPRALDAGDDSSTSGPSQLGLANANVQGYGAYDIIKVASLVEAEAKIDADRPLIASVIYNRLARGMPLQIDATLIYARGDPKDRTLSEQGQADRLAVQHLRAHRPAADADRGGERGVVEGRARARRLDVPLLRGRSTRRATRVRDDARAAEREHRDREARTARFDDLRRDTRSRA